MAIKSLSKRRPISKGSLNSRNPNPFELAYKELWDKLPEWKKNAFAEDISNKRYDWGLYSDFIKEVTVLADRKYAELEEAQKKPLTTEPVAVR